MNTPDILRIDMECPYCEVSSRLKIESMNLMVGCTFCKGEFRATTKPREIVRLQTGCSVTSQMYTWILQREVDDMYRVAHMITRTATKGFKAEPVIKARSIDITKFDLSGVRCPGCGNKGIDYCGCGGWVCQGGARHAPEGRYNHCPSCNHDGLFVVERFDVPIYNRAPLKAVAPQPPTVARRALPAASSLAKVLRKE